MSLGMRAVPALRLSIWAQRDQKRVMLNLLVTDTGVLNGARGVYLNSRLLGAARHVGAGRIASRGNPLGAVRIAARSFVATLLAARRHLDALAPTGALAVGGRWRLARVVARCESWARGAWQPLAAACSKGRLAATGPRRRAQVETCSAGSRLAAVVTMPAPIYLFCLGVVLSGSAWAERRLCCSGGKRVLCLLLQAATQTHANTRKNNTITTFAIGVRKLGLPRASGKACHPNRLCIRCVVRGTGWVAARPADTQGPLMPVFVGNLVADGSGPDADCSVGAWAASEARFVVGVFRSRG